MSDRHNRNNSRLIELGKCINKLDEILVEICPNFTRPYSKHTSFCSLPHPSSENRFYIAIDYEYHEQCFCKIATIFNMSGLRKINNLSELKSEYNKFLIDVTYE